MNPRFSGLQLGSIELFCKAAVTGSFTLAAEALGLTPAAVSRSITRLEQRLGVRLFSRTTRQVKLTEEGKLYYEQCREALQQIEEAERAITGSQAVPKGTLRISVPTTYGHYRVLPLVPLYRERYPEVDLEIDISNRNIDFVDEGYDLAIRLGNPADSGLVARKLEDATLGVFASPAYLKSAGTPATVADLDAHRCIQFVLPSTGRPLPWLFRDNGKDVEYQFRSSLQCSGDVLGCLTLARNGGGLVQMYHFIVEEDQRSGRLVEVAKESAGRSRPFSIFYPHNRHMPSRVRSFVDFLCEEIGKPKKN